jgi:hypothetical protein
MAEEADDLEDGDEDLDDLGAPIEELRDLAAIPSPGFFNRIRGSLRRRSLGSQLASLGWSGVGTVVFEFMQMIYALFQDKPTHRGE